MGYNTKFDGEFRLDRELDEDTYCALEELAQSDADEHTMPSLWCQWVVGDDWQSIKWNGGEKFYGYVGWIRYINEKILAPKGYVMNGVVVFQGEEVADSGRIVAENGKIEVFWNYDDQRLSNYDAKSKSECHIPEGQGVHWIDGERKIFVDVADLSWMVSETEDAAQSKLFGIVIGNPKATAVLVDISAEPGTNRAWKGFSGYGEDVNRVRVMSLDALLPYIDGERGARTRLTKIVAAARKHKHCGDTCWHIHSPFGR